MKNYILNNGDVSALGLRMGTVQKSDFLSKTFNKGEVLLFYKNNKYVVYVYGFIFQTERVFNSCVNARKYYARLNRVWGLSSRIRGTKYYALTRWLISDGKAYGTLNLFTELIFNNNILALVRKRAGTKYYSLNVQGVRVRTTENGHYIEYISLDTLMANFGMYRNNYDEDMRMNVLINEKVHDFLYRVASAMYEYGFLKVRCPKDYIKRCTQIVEI